MNGFNVEQYTSQFHENAKYMIKCNSHKKASVTNVTSTFIVHYEQ